METEETGLQVTARQIRGKIVELSYKAATSHVASALSCVDILTALYWKVIKTDPQNPNDPNRDRFILSKGHAVVALYSTLAIRGFYPDEFLQNYNKPGTTLPEHPSPHCAPGIEIGSGSLGHGLPIGIGMAMAARIQGLKPYCVYVLMGDGECNEGSVWEAALFAPVQKLNNLIAIIDYNKWQATGRSNEVMALDPLKQKWESFGWETHEIDGHDLHALIQTLQTASIAKEKPQAVIAHTVKGKGISFMEDDNNWHYRTIKEDEFRKAMAELGFDHEKCIC